MKDWEKSELDAVKIYGRKVPASGSGPGEKLDIIGEGKFSGRRGENKYTDKKSYVLTLENLEKMIRQGNLMLCTPFFRIDFGRRKKFILIEEDEFIYLCSLEHIK